MERQTSVIFVKFWKEIKHTKKNKTICKLLRMKLYFNYKVKLLQYFKNKYV